MIRQRRLAIAVVVAVWLACIARGEKKAQPLSSRGDQSTS